MLAAERKNAELVAVLLAAGANPNKSCSGVPGDTALRLALEVGAIEVVRALVRSGADCSATAWDGRSAKDFVRDAVVSGRGNAARWREIASLVGA